MGPPGRASGTAGVSNRSRARPGCSLGGTIWATAADERTTNATDAAMARTPANMTQPRLLQAFHGILSLAAFRTQSEPAAINCHIPPIFSDVSIRSHSRLIPSERIHGSYQSAQPRVLRFRTCGLYE